MFPINRRHQGLATFITKDYPFLVVLDGFPINRRHQGLATLEPLQKLQRHGFTCFQSIGVTKDWRLPPDGRSNVLYSRFQSIGVTKYWRRGPTGRQVRKPQASCFQSIGVTKDWRPGRFRIMPKDPDGVFPINRRHQGLATFLSPHRI